MNEWCGRYRLIYSAELSVGGKRATFNKPNGSAVTLEPSAEGLLATEAGKPPMRFVRVRAD